MQQKPKSLRVSVREQEAKVRATNFDEVCYGYNIDEAIEESKRCLNCKNAKCIKACPVGINIPEFIQKILINFNIQKSKPFLYQYYQNQESGTMNFLLGIFTERFLY